jgi:hypothetical protein
MPKKRVKNMYKSNGRDPSSPEKKEKKTPETKAVAAHRRRFVHSPKREEKREEEEINVAIVAKAIHIYLSTPI